MLEKRPRVVVLTAGALSGCGRAKIYHPAKIDLMPAAGLNYSTTGLVLELKPIAGWLLKPEPEAMRPGERLPRRGMLLLLSMSALIFSGCASTKYQMTAGKDARPAQLLELQAVDHMIGVKLNAILVYDGPGAWKRQAFWDEYVVQLSNPSDQPVILESALVLGAMDMTSLAGDQPWQLEKQGEANLKQWPQTLGSFKNKVFVPSHPLVPAPPDPAKETNQADGDAVMIVLSPVWIPVAIVHAPFWMASDYRHKGAVEQEFNRRRLPLPLTLAPGTTVTGSLFFALTPGMHSLVLSGHSGENPFTVTLTLGSE